MATTDQDRPAAQEDLADQQAAFEQATAEQPSHYDPDGAHREATDANGAASMSQAKDVAHAQPPAEFTGLKLTETDTVAGGVPAVVATLKYAFGEMGVGRSLKTLAHVNQPDGFDCPGCAWPEPDSARPPIESCENGP